MLVGPAAEKRPLTMPLHKVARTDPSHIFHQRVRRAGEKRFMVLVLQDVPLVGQVVFLVADQVSAGAAELAHE
jgi:hypothetical protein